MIALTPTASGQAFFQYPRSFQVHEPEGYYRLHVEPRLITRAQRAYWDAAHRGIPRNPKAGGEEDGADGHAGGASDVKQLYPAGKAMTSEEIKLALEHAPLDSKGKIKCWDACTWRSCSRSASECSRSHLEPIRSLQGCHWAVQCQLIKRGGLKSQPRIEVTEIDGRISQLRSQAQQSANKNRADGLARAKAKAARRAAGSTEGNNPSEQDRNKDSAASGSNQKAGACAPLGSRLSSPADPCTHKAGNKELRVHFCFEEDPGKITEGLEVTPNLLDAPVCIEEVLADNELGTDVVQDVTPTLILEMDDKTDGHTCVGYMTESMQEVPALSMQTLNEPL
eukprot:6471875-Amphidinium_carterae.1